MNYNSKKYNFCFAFWIIICLLFINSVISAALHPDKEGYVSINQGKLYYQTFGLKDSPMIVLHGGPGGDHSYFLPQMLQLAENHQVTFYDQRGSGKSLDTPFTKDVINLNQFVEDLESLRRFLGYENFTLLGFSWGGRLAMEYAIKYPNRLNSMILVSSSSSTLKGQQAYEENFSKLLLIKYPELAELFDPLKFVLINNESGIQIYKILLGAYLYDKTNINKITLHFNKTSFASGLSVAKFILTETWLQPNFDLRPKLKHLNIPTLIIHGAEDPTPLWSAEEMQKATPNSELYVIPNCSHFPFIEQPEAFFDKIAKFLD